MIIKLVMENFKAFLEPTTVTFAAGTTSRLAGNLLRHRNGERFVKSMAIYGHNASGKTTALDAIYALWSFVDFSSQDQKPTSRIPRFESFALDRSWSRRPSRIALTVEFDDDRYTLDVSATANRVWSETLTVQRMTKQPSRKLKSKTLIERIWKPDGEHYSTTLHDALGPRLTRDSAIEQTTPNRLMLGKLASMNSDVARRITEWFDRDVEFYDMNRNPVSEDAMLEKCARLAKDDEAFGGLVARLIRDADTGICELRIDDEKSIVSTISPEDKSVKFEESTDPVISFRHATEDNSEVFFHRKRESSGTLRFVALLAAILDPSPRRRLVCVDELSASLHPSLVHRLVRIIHSSRYNPLGHQLLFTTHDTHLMNTLELLRRDQITLCHKNRFGRSTTTRLDEFQDAARSDANLQKQYLEGRFGSVPLFGPTLEDVPIDDKPMEVAT